MSDPKIIRVGGQDGFGGLYNTVLGDGKERGRLLLAAASLGLDDFGRARDAWVERLENGTLRWAVYTRNGGHNRADYAKQIRVMQRNDFYHFDADDTFDSTYATFYFKVPEELQSDDPKFATLKAVWPRVHKDLTETGRTNVDWLSARPPVDTNAMWEAALERVSEDPAEARRVAEIAFPNLDLATLFTDPSEEDK